MLRNWKEGKISISHSITCLMEKTTPTGDMNPQPLDHEAYDLPLFYNHCPISPHSYFNALFACQLILFQAGISSNRLKLLSIFQQMQIH